MTYYSYHYYQNGRTFVVDLNGKAHDLCEEFAVVSVRKNVDTRESLLTVEIMQSDGSVEPVEMTREQALLNPLPDLVKVGLSVANTPVYAVTVAEIIMESEKSAPVEYVHSNLGLKDIDGELVYFGARALTSAFKSRYIDYEKLRPSGTVKEWRDGLLPFVKEKPEMLLALAMGASAPVAGLLEKAGVFNETLMWAMIGGSSRGKTTMLRLSSSTWGRCDEKGVLDSLLGTENYLIARLASHGAFPYFIDETSAQNWDFTKAIYNIAMSTERGRCNPDGTPKLTKTWSATSVVFTGEKSLLAQSNGNGGLHARLIELDFMWTKDGASAKQLTRFLSVQHGTAYKPFVKKLLGIDSDALVNLYDEHTERLLKIMSPRNGVEERIVQKLAILSMTVEIMTQAWKIAVEQSTIDDLLTEIFRQNAPQSDKVQVWYEALKQYIASHESLFPDRQALSIPTFVKSNKQGMLDKHKGRRCVWIMSEFFEKFLDEHGLCTATSTLHDMRDRGMLAYFSDRFRKKQTIGDMEPICFCLLLEDTPVAGKGKAKKAI